MPAISKHDDYPVLEFKSGDAFEKWLVKNYAKSDGIWIKIAKKSTGIPSITYEETVEIGLCHGWIDGLRRSVDENYFVQKSTPRRANSNWSAINKKKVAALIKSGKMKTGGLAAIEEAKANGRWAAAK